MSYVDAKTVLKSVQSSVWRYFKFRAVGDDYDKSFVHCKLCLDAGNKKKGQVKYCGGTTNLVQHLKSWHNEDHKAVKEEEEKAKGKKESILHHFAARKSVEKWPKSHQRWKDLTMALAKWFCKSTRLISHYYSSTCDLISQTRSTMMVEDPGFVAFMELACPGYEMPKRKTVAKYIKDLYDEEKEKVKASLEDVEFCAITTDGGSSSNATSFQVFCFESKIIIVHIIFSSSSQSPLSPSSSLNSSSCLQDTNIHFIDGDMKLRSKCLAVNENKEAHTAENYRANYDDVLEDFGVEGKVVKTITDNENKMKSSFLDEERSGCMAHIIHSSVTEGYKQTPDVKVVIEKVRKIATKYHKSYAFKYNLQEEQKKRDLPVRAILQDVPTRWGSTRAATGSFLDKVDKDEEESNKASEVFRERFNNIDAINAALRKIKYRGDQKLSQYLITEDDIGKISTLNKFLTKLDIFSTTLGGDKFVTSSIVFPVMAAMKKLLKPDNSDPVYIAKLKEVILEDFVKRANSNIDGNFLLLATALDPRWKDLKVITKESRDRAFGRLKKEMMSLQPSTSSGTEQEQESKPKRRLLDFDASDESIEEEDELDAELSRLLIDKLSICNL